MKNFRRAKKRTEVSVGEVVPILRELQQLSQDQLSERTAIPQATISAIERFGAKIRASRPVTPGITTISDFTRRSER